VPCDGNTVASVTHASYFAACRAANFVALHGVENCKIRMVLIWVLEHGLEDKQGDAVAMARRTTGAL
jgi:hypothetical protein